MKWCPPPQGAFIEKCLPILPGLAFDHCNRVGTEKHYIYIYKTIRKASPGPRRVPLRKDAARTCPSSEFDSERPSHYDESEWGDAASGDAL